MKYISKKKAQEILDLYKGNTAYFTYSTKMKDMYVELRVKGYGEAETYTIIAALILAGAQFT